MYNIDDFDMKILTLLQANGRLTNQELSELVGSPPPNVRGGASAWSRRS